MLNKIFRREQETARRTVAQDGFSAPVETAPPAVSPRPWHDAPTAPVAPVAPVAPAVRTAPAVRAAYAVSVRGGYASTAGRRVIDFADNGDGTLTAVRCMDMQVDDLDVQFEAGACPVTAIAPKAFSGCTALRRVVLPAGLTQIGEMAFSGCAKLMQVTIPGGVQRVGTLAFAKCAGLERVRIEPGVTALGPSCFSKCASLTRVDVPASLTAFGGGVFFGCGRQLCLYGAEESAAQQYAALNGVRFDSQSWREDEVLAFEEREDGSLVVTGARQEAPVRVEIPSEICGRKIVAIAPKAFFACGTLCQLFVGANVREIGESAFFGCRSLVCAGFERGLERVGDSAFAGCEGLSQVTLPWGTGAVGRMAFFGCTRLAFVKMPATTRVADFAFDGCAPNLRVFGGVYAGRMAGANI